MQEGGRNRMKRLSKSNYLHGIQCNKRLYLEMAGEVEGEAPTEADLRRLRQGNEVTQAARERFRGGVLIRGEGQSIDDVVRETRKAIAAGNTVLFEAAFQHAGAYAYTDVLERQDDGTWHLIEVKMSKKDDRPDKEHLRDASFQTFVARGSGLPISKVSLMLINGDFVHPDRGDLFAFEEVTELLGDASSIATEMSRLQQALEARSVPDIQVSRHCWTPQDCPFMFLCWEEEGKPTIFDIHNNDLHWTQKDKLQCDGHFYVEDIPKDYALKPKAREAIERVINKRVEIDREQLNELMDELEPPLAFLDFEADSYPIPQYEGTKPYQKIPFQFSLHIVKENGEIDHEEYLHVELGDPREALAIRLLERIPESGSVVVYSNYEHQVLDQLCADFPELARSFKGIQERIWDQLTVFEGPYRHHAFADSNSIKNVLPVLAPDLKYDSLRVRDGTQAQVAWEQIQKREGDWQTTAHDLREYCKLDTFAMVKLHQHLECVVEETQ